MYTAHGCKMNWTAASCLIIESVDSICRDSADTQYTVKNGMLFHWFKINIILHWFPW